MGYPLKEGAPSHTGGALLMEGGPLSLEGPLLWKGTPAYGRGPSHRRGPLLTEGAPLVPPLTGGPLRGPPLVPPSNQILGLLSWTGGQVSFSRYDHWIGSVKYKAWDRAGQT